MVMFMALIDEKSEQKQFETIYAGYGKQMLAAAYRVLEDPGEAEDAVQNALLGIAKHIGKSERTVKRMTPALIERGLLERENGKRNGKWLVKCEI